MPTLERLFKGYRDFRKEHFLSDNTLYNELAEKGQSPEILVISCSDSRVDPSIITKAAPGEIFVIRNVANLVPPYSPSKNEFHGTSAALEFAVKHLNVRHIIVMGHSRCAGIYALINYEKLDKDEFSYIRPWINISSKAKEKVLREFSGFPKEKLIHECSKESIRVSLDNLLTFPWIKEKTDKGKLEIHGWHFSLKSGNLKILDKKTGKFKLLDSDTN